MVGQTVLRSDSLNNALPNMVGCHDLCRHLQCKASGNSTSLCPIAINILRDLQLRCTGSEDPVILVVYGHVGMYTYM